MVIEIDADINIIVSGEAPQVPVASRNSGEF
jgi:hypothetical protein